MKQVRWATRPLAFLLWIGRGRPSLLWHCFISYLRYFLLKLGVPSRPAKHVADIRAEFQAHAAQGQFKELYFDAYDINVVLWCDTFPRIFNRADPVRILEIGSWEGRSALFFLTYFPQGRLTAVDRWYDAQDIEAHFDANLASCAARLTKHKGSSLQVLPQLVDEQEFFDVIYVDGSHFADDVLADGIAAWRLLKQDGILIFDDFLWCGYERARANPAWAINLFLKYHKGEYRILNVYSQIILQKKITFNDEMSTDFLAFAISASHR